MQSPLGSESSKNEERTTRAHDVANYGTALCAGGSLACAWLLPGGLLSAALGWLTAFLCCVLLRKENPYRLLYIVGIVSHLFAFYWLHGTIRHFGHFGVIASGAIFALFVTVSALQFWLVAFFFRSSRLLLDRFCLAAPLAWGLGEAFAVKIFPWHLGHTQLGFTWLAQVADIGGALCISILLVWSCDAILRLLTLKEKPQFTVAMTFLFAALVYGAYQTKNIETLLSNSETPPLQVLLVQGNVSLEQKHDPTSKSRNILLYKKLTEASLTEPSLVVWPETVLLEFLFEEIGSASKNPLLPIFPDLRNSEKALPPATVLLGALAFDRQREIYNSAFAVLPDGSVPQPYHKQLLMPFGEYTPFGDLFPWIREINSTAADFSAGPGPGVFALPHPDDTNTIIKTSTLICYEDVAPSLSRAATLAGAQILVNMTNDAWFGPTAAPHQHNLIASFRAIENKRFLLRATNTGLTNIVNPLGKTTHSLPVYTEGTLSASLRLITPNTVYTQIVGDKLHWGLLLIWASVAICGKLKRRKA